MAGSIIILLLPTASENWPPSKPQLKKVYSIYSKKLHTDLEQILHSPDFPKTKLSLRQVKDWLIYPEDKVICSRVDREFGFLIYKE